MVPQLQFFKVDPNWEFVVVGSDGVWDAMSSQEMSNYVKVRGYIHSFIYACIINSLGIPQYLNIHDFIG